MAIESAADRLALLDDWGVDATYGAHTIAVIYDEEYVELMGISGDSPVVLGRTSDFETAEVAEGGTLAVNGASFTVRVIQNDGTGMTKLILESA